MTAAVQWLKVTVKRKWVVSKDSGAVSAGKLVCVKSHGFGARKLLTGCTCAKSVV